MATILVKDANGTIIPLEKPLPPGRAAATISRPVVLSVEDLAAIEAIGETVPGTVTGATIGNASAELLAADPDRRVVMIQNVSATATIAVRSGAAAALNVAGNFMAGPNGYIVFEGAAAEAAINAISESAGTPATVGVG